MFGNRNFKLITGFVFPNLDLLLAGKLLEKSNEVNLWAVEQVFRSSFHFFPSIRIFIRATETDKVVEVAKKCAMKRNNGRTWICGVNSRLDVIDSGACAFSSVVSARRIGEIGEPAKSLSDPLERLVARRLLQGSRLQWLDLKFQGQSHLCPNRWQILKRLLRPKIETKRLSLQKKYFF